MPGKVTLVVTAGLMTGRRFEFSGHDTFIFGRASDCHAELPQGDTSASRHHFLLEVNPPAARLRDLGSLNGTHVNGLRHGGRGPGGSPEEAARRASPEVDLSDGDEIRVGATIFRITIETDTRCCDCEKPIAEADKKASEWLGGTYLCDQCRQSRRTSLTPPAIQGLPKPEAQRSVPESGGSIAGYDLGEVLGRGGMGAVYSARRRTDGAAVAVKIMLPQVLVDEAARVAFLREIEVTRSLRHPRIVELIDFGSEGEGFFFAMELCPGGSASSLGKAKGGRLDLPRVLRLVVEALEGLAFAHEWGFVHRDIKPDNILIAADGSARLTDFGLAKSFQQAGLSGMTATGTVAGTPYFMPREQLTSFRQVRPASDVWSMGATLYYMLTARHVREFGPGKDPLALILRGGIVPIRSRDPALPEALARVVDRAIADDAKDRYATGGEFLDALVAVAKP